MRKNLLIFFAALASAISALAYDFEADGIYYNFISVNNLTCEVTKGNTLYFGYSGDIVIPSTVSYNEKTFNVISIGAYAFSKSTGLTSVTIPNSVTSIGKSAFSSCTGLTSVTIPNSVTSIGANAFSGCTGLTSVTIPNSVTYIADHAFSNCSGLKSVTLSESLTTTGDYAFWCCKSLTSVIIPNSVTIISQYSFYGCSSLTSVTIPKSVKSIYIYAFCCSGLTSVTIPESVTSIDNYAFISCSSLKEITSLAIIPPRIGEDTFDGVSKTETVVKVPDESVEAYKSATYWSKFWNIVGGASGIPSVEVKKTVIMRAQDGNIIVSGTERGESIELYNIDGQQICNLPTDDDQTIIPYSLGKGQIVIVRYGGKSVKILM